MSLSEWKRSIQVFAKYFICTYSKMGECYSRSSFSFFDVLEQEQAELRDLHYSSPPCRVNPALITFLDVLTQNVGFTSEIRFITSQREFPGENFIRNRTELCLLSFSPRHYLRG